MRGLLIAAAVVIVAVVGAMALGLIDIDMAGGKLPEVEVTEGETPEVAVTTGEVTTGTKTIEVEVPTVAIEEAPEAEGEAQAEADAEAKEEAAEEATENN